MTLYSRVIVFVSKLG